MFVIPAIEIQNGRCVSLNRGRLDEPQIWHVDPIKRAKAWTEAGAERLHLTDFDAVAGRPDTNRALITDIIKNAGLPVQFGGGLHSMDAIRHWIDAGADRIVLSSAAVHQPELVKQAAAQWPDRIALAVDVYQGKVMAGGWQQQSAFEPDTFIRHFNGDPLAAVIVTDIDADIEDSDASLALVTQLAAEAEAPVIARGTIRGLDDVARLKYVPHVAGALVSRALFDRSLSLGDAVAVAAAPREDEAEFL
ncbi:HisA/HisF-related TIM barrel protein [Sulfitobacter aestuariivivens]|uniref:1-(5-phosphoribosyl)-5-[(5-phosphoribosylamino)methylideneamino] imidazole-4-carboxamide isomerase n=1 Tax=Sulfitobacter aestuariivivens TaxID=2766981 RepID=A0A927D1I2_9RHOB|nr:1-(5-phosphoribosyl)-5-[(5-phosphoribosylamino)methylideneamino] imidazole-4-carboxamide isomerase [Sulfitobacter aestuariivivens]MBD3662676.1 1-(5-phosphoribosyl)-5-[(5-phosphoribosylamino)methylideneamino] imidazole-4-carboxamide isomerase [Sulfitobacter aestuariivivens]